MEAVEPLAGEELERMLARFARVRLEPSQGQARRARTAVMDHALRHLDGASVLLAPDAVSAGAARRRRAFGGWGPRRVGVAFAAASMAGLMLGTSVFAASRAGGPLYESRLALESLTLPADPAERAAAQLARADARLGEAVEAGFRHDDNAVAAALEAYDQALEDLSATSGGASDEMIAALQRHRTVLLQLAAQVPSTATNGIDLALSSSDRVIDRLAEAGDEPGTGDGRKPGGAGSGTNGGGSAGGGEGAGRGAGPAVGAGNGAGAGNGNANGEDNGNGGANGGGGNGSKPATGTPAPTEAPAAATPRPTAAPTEKPTAGPHATPDPARSPKPHRSAPPSASSVETPIRSPSTAGSDAP